MDKPVIQAEKLTKTYRLYAEDVHAVQDVDLTVNAGEFVCIMGPSGSGKTTLLDMIGCLDSITSGSLTVLGHEVSNMKEHQLAGIRRGKIGFVFQDFSLIPSLTALENLELAMYLARAGSTNGRAADLLERMGLGHRRNHLPRQLSGGEKQRVAIARALTTNPSILLADEPTGHLDAKNSQEIFNLLSKLNAEQGLTIVLVTHDERLGKMAQRSLYIEDGRLKSRTQ